MTESNERVEVLKKALISREKKLGLKNKELQKLVDLEEKHIHEGDARNVIDDIDDLIKNSIKDLDLESFLREDEEENNIEDVAESTEENVEGNNDS